MNDINNSDEKKCNPSVTEHEYRKRPTIAVDYDLYMQYLDDTDLSEDKKREFVDALWSIIVSFVDLGFDIHPLQQVCEQEGGLYDYLLTPDGETMVTKVDNIVEELETVNDKLKDLTKDRSQG